MNFYTLWTEAHRRKINVQRYEYFGLLSKLISCFNSKIQINKKLGLTEISKRLGVRRQVTECSLFSYLLVVIYES